MILGQRFSGKQNNGAQRRLWVWHGKCPYCDATLVVETLLAKAYPAAVSYSITTFQVRGDALLSSTGTLNSRTAFSGAPQEPIYYQIKALYGKIVL